MSASNPPLKFSTDIFDSRERRDAWIEGMRYIHGATPLDRDNTDFNGDAEIWVANGLRFSNFEFDAQIMDFSPNIRHPAIEEDALLVAMYKEGQAWVLHGDKPMVYNANSICIVDGSRNRRTVSSAAKVQGVTLPYSSVGYEAGKQPGCMVLPNEKPAAFLVNSLAQMIFKKLPTAKPKDVEIMSGMFAGMMRGLIGSDTNEISQEQAVMARRAVMRQFVIDNISDLNLDVATLCQRFDVSRATVFRDFEPGGLQHFIMIHRLNQALNDIAFGPAIRGRIAMIARKWGFSSPAHFSRAFKESFGFSPSDATGAGRWASAAVVNKINVESDWLIPREK